jgi:undecaprenyl diphosphate synthase
VRTGAGGNFKGVTSAAPTQSCGARGRVPLHMAWVASGSAAWAAMVGAAPAVLEAAEDRALRALVDASAAAGVRWLTVQEPTAGRGLRPERDQVRRTVRVASLDDAGSLPPLSDGLTVLLTARGRGRAAIVEAVRRLADEGVRPADVDEKAIGSHLDAPDVDLLVHTGGDRRVHDLLLWEVAYSELVVLDVPWPEVDRGHVDQALAEYGRRDRRYGGIVTPAADQ